MSEQMSRLLSFSSTGITGPPNPDALRKLASGISPLLEQELAALLADKNGFFCFESALLIRPLEYERSPVGIVRWNNPKLWKEEYRLDLTKSIFFAEDLFGVQFCTKANCVHSFDPETGAFTQVAETLEHWARWILEDHRARTAWPLARQWQEINGPLSPGTRLLPKVPFVCGGKFSVENLYALRDVEGMRFRASLANQLIDVPDGTKIVFRIERKG